MRRTRLLILAACAASPAALATNYTSVQNGEYYCTGMNQCAFNPVGTPGGGDSALIQHVVSVNGGQAGMPNPLNTGAVNLVAGGTFGIYGGQRLNFSGGGWSGGRLDSCCNGGGIFANQAFLEITATSLSSYRSLIENNGTMRFSDGARLSYEFNGGGILSNLTSGPTPAVLQFDGSGRIEEGGVIYNEGILRKTGAGTSVLQGTVHNRGTSAIYPGRIEVVSGELALADVGAHQANLYQEGGHFSVAADAVFAIRDGGEMTLVPSSGAAQPYVTTGSGAGKVRLQSGGAIYGIGPLSGGVAAAVMDFDPGVFEWTGGLLGYALIRNEGEITVLGNDAKLLGGQMDNAGVIRLQTQTLPLGVLQVVPGGLLEVQNDSEIVSGANNPRLIVNGLLRKLPGAGTLTVSGMNLEGSGTVEIEGGHLALPETGSYYRMGNFRGTLRLIANAEVDTTGVLQIYESAVKGVGRINAPLEQRALLEPGAPFGAIEVGGGLSQFNPAVTRIAIGGSAPLTQTAQVQVGGDLYANGVLRVNFRDGYSPYAGDSFDLITVGGSFSNGIGGYQVVIEGLAPGFQYTLTQSPQNTVRLTALNHVLSLDDYMFADGFE